MIAATVFLEDNDTRIADLRLNVLPAVGELLWFVGEAQGRMAKEHGTSAFTVRAVAHWCATERLPAGSTDNYMHTAALYVEPLRRGGK